MLLCLSFVFTLAYHIFIDHKELNPWEFYSEPRTEGKTVVTLDGVEPHTITCKQKSK